MRNGPADEAPGGRAGLGDTPRQDSQRPEHADHADAGGQESTNRRFPRTQIPDAPHPEGAPPVPGAQHADPPLPVSGRQAQRPGQDGRAEERIGARDAESFRSADAPGFGDESAREAGRDAGARDSAASRRSSASSASGRGDHAVGAEEPPASPPRR